MVQYELLIFVPGLDQPSMGHLIHACFLLSQHHRRYGRSIEDSLTIACLDVYVKSRSLSHEQRDIVSSVIVDELNQSHIVSTCNIPQFYHTPSTQSLQFNSSFSQIQSQGVLLLLFVHLASENLEAVDLSVLLFSKLPLSDDFRSVFNLSALDLRNMLLYCLIRFYDLASPSDAVFRHFWISQVISHYSKNTSTLSHLIELSETLMHLVVGAVENVSVNQQLDRRSLPWDLRRMSALLFDKVDDLCCGKVSLKMDYALLKHRCLKLDNVPTESQNMDVNLSQYSDACTLGRITSR